MQMNQVKARMFRVEQCAHDAMLACRSADGLPEDLQQCVQELDRRSHEAMQMMEDNQDEWSIRQCVEDLEEIGDRAMAACRDAGSVDQRLSSAVKQAHDELSNLKHQLH